MRQLVELLRRVAPSNVIVTVLGESGTGKELVAKALHEASPRAGQPFVPLNCGALSPSVIESELFGHEKGGIRPVSDVLEGIEDGPVPCSAKIASSREHVSVEDGAERAQAAAAVSCGGCHRWGSSSSMRELG
jgi:hypothetical protein